MVIIEPEFSRLLRMEIREIISSILVQPYLLLLTFACQNLSDLMINCSI